MKGEKARKSLKFRAFFFFLKLAHCLLNINVEAFAAVLLVSASGKNRRGGAK